MSNIKISTKNLDLYYGENHALKNINMNIKAGAITAFIGPSGCGKSTFLKTLNRMNDLVDNVKITGEVKIDGEDIYDPHVDVTLLRKNAGMVFQQPIAQDLRTVSSILKVVTDIERIGDHASDIAELIQQMDHKQLERYSGHLQPMIAASREMVHEAVSAFVARDQKKANDVIASDDIIDKLFDKVKNDIVIHIKEDRSDAIESLDALMLAKYLERIGDHAVNICEWEIFRETGTIQNTKVF